MARLQKSKTLVTLLFRSGVVSLENYCATLLGFKMNFDRTPMYRTLLLIFVMSCTGVEPRQVKHYRVEGGKEIRYVDLISLYPYICYYGKFPVGHPKVYVGADCPPDSLDREGVTKCKVLPHRGLYNPVLPYKSNSKLMFPLCSTCADTMNQDDCTRSDEERCIVGTWVVDEVRKAVEMGYDLMDVNEFWEYEVTCFVKDTNSAGIFAEYVNMFLKLKQESSGFPSWVQSEENKDKYIED